MAIVEVCGFNDWLLKLLDEYGCRDTVLIQPEKRSRHKTDPRDANALGELLWVNRHRVLAGQKVANVRRVLPPSAEDAEARLGSITKQGSAIARFILGQMVLHALRRDGQMKAWYARIKKRRGSKIARVAVMRRLATILWHMVKHNEPYRVGGPPRQRVPAEVA